MAVVVDHEGKHTFWIADLDAEPCPGRSPIFQAVLHAGRNGDIFLTGEETSAYVYRVQSDGTGLQKVTIPFESPAQAKARGALFGLSADGDWLAMRDYPTDSLVAAATEGTGLIRICSGFPSNSRISWSANGKEVFFSVPTAPSATELIGRTYVIPLPTGKVWPTIPPGGFRSLDDLVTRTGAKVVEAYDAAPGPRPGIYAFSRASAQRNLYRVPIP